MSIALVNHKAAVSGNGTSVTTAGVDTTGANLLIVGVSWYSPGGSPTISDSKGNTWTPLTSYGSALLVSLFYCTPSSVGSGHTFTASAAGTIYPAIAMAAFSGAASSSVVGAQAGNNATATTLATGSITPGSDGQLVASAFSFNSGSVSGVDSGLTIIDTLAPGGNNYGLSLAYLVQGSAAPINPTWTDSLSAILGAGVASFKAAGGSGATFQAAWARGVNQLVGGGY